MTGLAYGILLLRLVVGLTLVAHGAQKLFRSFGGYGPYWTAGFLSGLDFRAPRFMAFAVGLAELLGGLLFASGLLTPLAAFAIAVVTLNAIGAVHWRRGFWNANDGYEFSLLIWSTAVAVAFMGAGRLSLDAALGWDDAVDGLWSGLGVLGGGVALSTVSLTRGRYSAEPPPAAPASVTKQAALQEGSSGSADGSPTLGAALRPLVRRTAFSRREQLVDQSTNGRARIDIQVPGASEGGDLIDCLWTHGFSARLVESSGRWRVELRSTSVRPPRLVVDLVVALESWLLESRRSGLLLRIGDRRYTMTPR